MKVLFILDEFLPENSGGAANVAFALAKGLMVAGNELLVVTATHDPEKVGKLKIDNVQIEIIFSKPFGRFRNWKNLKNRGILRQASSFLKDFNPDVVHIHTLHHRFSYGIISLAKKFSKTVVLLFTILKLFITASFILKEKSAVLVQLLIIKSLGLID